MTRPGRSAGWWCERRAAVSILFATMIIPLIMLVGIAIDYTNYNQILSQLSLAADAGAIHAVRVAENQFVVTGNAANAIAAGNRAAAQWYAAELYNFSGNASVTPATANVQYDRDTHSFTETVTYGGTYRTAFGRLFQVATWNIGGSSSASVTTNSYVEVAMLIDNSSSMQIGAGPADIQTIEGWTLCPPAAAAAAEQQSMSAYSWNWPAPYGYDSTAPHSTLPTPSVPAPAAGGTCNAAFTGPASECPYPPSMTLANGQITQIKTSLGVLGQPVDANGFCPAGYGVPDAVLKRVDPATKAVGNLPQAPCGFACHTTGAPVDYFTMVKAAQAAGSGVKLRLDVILAAAANVVAQMKQAQAAESVPNLYSLGVYEFNNSVTQLYPAAGTEAGTDLDQGSAAIVNTQTPAVIDAPNTDFPAAMATLASQFTAAGNGSTAARARKNLFIITDGLADYGSRVMGPMAAANCKALKQMGFTLYVLYTPYSQLPNNFYLQNDTGFVEPITASPDIAALQACASGSNNSNFFVASSSSDINQALSTMLKAALNTPAIITN